MAVNWEKYSKPVERRKPVIFLMNMSANENSSWPGNSCCCERHVLREVIFKLIDDFKSHNYRIDVSIVGFGSGVNLILPYTDICKIDMSKLYEKLAKSDTPNSAVFGTGLLAVKDMLEDLEETPENIYVPTVILLTTNEPSPGWEGCLEEFTKEGRSSKCQRMAIYSDRKDKDTRFIISDKTEINGKVSNSKLREKVFFENETSSESDKIKNNAVKAFAECGMKICFSSSPMSATDIACVVEQLSFEILDEEKALVEVKKEVEDIPILENAEFDGNSMDEDSFI